MKREIIEKFLSNFGFNQENRIIFIPTHRIKKTLYRLIDWYSKEYPNIRLKLIEGGIFCNSYSLGVSLSGENNLGPIGKDLLSNSSSGFLTILEISKKFFEKSYCIWDHDLLRLFTVLETLNRDSFRIPPGIIKLTQSSDCPNDYIVNGKDLMVRLGFPGQGEKCYVSQDDLRIIATEILEFPEIIYLEGYLLPFGIKAEVEYRPFDIIYIIENEDFYKTFELDKIPEKFFSRQMEIRGIGIIE